MQIDDIPIEDGNVLNVGNLNVLVRVRSGLLCLNRYSPIGRSVLFYGEHAQNELDFCASFIAPGGVVLDIGAHQGTHTVVFAKAVGPSGVVYAFEPQRLMFQNICASIALNSIDNVTALNVAVGSYAGRVRIADFDYGKRAHFSGMRITPENTGEEVNLVSVDSVIRPEHIDKVEFMKIDVEGMEIDVLQGAVSILEKSLPIVYCEYHARAGNKNLDRSVIKFLKERGYVIFVHEPAGFNVSNFYRHNEDRFRGGVDHNVICIHHSKLVSAASHLAGVEPI